MKPSIGKTIKKAITKPIVKPVVLTIAALALSNTVLAGHGNDRHYDRHDNRYEDHHRDYDDRRSYRDSKHRNKRYGKVIHVKPIYRKYRNRHYDNGYYRSSSAKPLLGAVLGGGIGHALGNNKKSKRVGTVVGAVVGAAIASNSRKSRRNHDSYRDNRQHDYRREIIGYKVKYRYRGRIYHTRTDYTSG